VESLPRHSTQMGAPGPPPARVQQAAASSERDSDNCTSWPLCTVGGGSYLCAPTSTSLTMAVGIASSTTTNPRALSLATTSLVMQASASLTPCACAAQYMEPALVGAMALITTGAFPMAMPCRGRDTCTACGASRLARATPPGDRSRRAPQAPGAAKHTRPHEASFGYPTASGPAAALEYTTCKHSSSKAAGTDMLPPSSDAHNGSRAAPSNAGARTV